ncbi:unnamed protein product [Linum tenue]|uniref:Peptidase A1 domain-containing protein n=1 Tax=Linum tenue TaxID=586396 RepID=A0AAV0LIL7_9ROSI|nr:unnamed protein product [Linum tenue]
MNISIGTPPFPILAVADTGSDVVWTQCKPCSSCYDQDAPIFDPAASSSYKTVPCSSNACSSLQAEGAYCSSTDAVCHYKVGYGDRSHTYGDLALDTVTLVPSDFFAQLSDAVDSQVVGGEKARDPQDFLSLCYVADYSRLQVPPITFNFQGADVELTRDNAFVQVSDTVTCLAFYGSDDASIYGNVAQQNFLIGYDLQKGTVSFKPTDCATN